MLAAKTAFNIPGPGGEIVKLIQKLGYKHSNWKVFEDFLQMAAISISNSVDWIHSKEREVVYMDIVGRYDKEEVNLFPEMLAHLINALEDAITTDGLDDILGKVYHSLELHNKYKGQFFTPFHICEMMGKMSIGEPDKVIEDKGFVSVCEPCCGSGAMVLGFAKAMYDAGYNYQQQMVVTATDVDLKCVHMCYLQLSLMHIPAVIIHGNSLTMEEWSRWYTPAYMLDGWLWRQSCGNFDKRYPEDEAMKMADPVYAAVQKVKAVLDDGCDEPHQPQYDIELKVEQNGQLSFYELEAS